MTDSARISFTQFEKQVREWTRPINDQYPRPWMSDLNDPTTAQVFVVGRNQATPFPVNLAGTHKEYLDALFNRSGRSHADLYTKVRQALGKRSSQTRGNTEELTRLLKQHGVLRVIETNVICYSTPMSADLARQEHAGGKDRGTLIFWNLLEAIQPQALIAHGANTRRDLAKLINTTLPEVPTSEPQDVVCKEITLGSTKPYRILVVVIPSLAPPAWNRWSSWAQAYLDRVAAVVSNRVSPLNKNQSLTS